MSSRRTRQKSFLEKVLEYFTIGDAPVRKEGHSVDIDFYTVKNFLAKENAEQFLSILRRHGPAFTPKYWEHLDSCRLIKLDPEDMEGPAEMWMRRLLWLFSKRDADFHAHALKDQRKPVIGQDTRHEGKWIGNPKVKIAHYMIRHHLSALSADWEGGWLMCKLIGVHQAGSGQASIQRSPG